MIGLLQRVQQAAVHIGNNKIAHIDQGLLVFIGVERNDTERQANRLLTRLLSYRVFSDFNDKMNLSLTDIDGGLLLVPQFTLPADTQKGTRPSFSPVASHQQGRKLFDYFCIQARQQHHTVETGQFGADMQIHLTNDGPVPFWLQVPPNSL